MTKCKTCLHPRVADIDAGIASGRSFASVAKLVGGISNDSVKRHARAGHVAPLGGATPPPKTHASAAGGSAYTQMKVIADNLATVDVSKLSERDKLTHLDAYRRAVETLGRLEPPRTVEETELEARYRVEHLEGEAVDHVLERFPEAFEAVAEALRALRA